MGDAAVEDDSTGYPRTAAIAETTTSTPTIRTLGVRRGVARAGSL
jgi:hypothetical protein